MNDLPVNPVDVVVVLVLFLSAVPAFFRGFIHEVLSVAGWIGAAVVAAYAFPHIRPHLDGLVPVGWMADVAAAGSVFLVTLVLLSILTHAVSGSILASGLGILDRSLGFLFGALRGAVVLCLVYMVVESAVPPADQPAWLGTARSLPLIKRGAATLRALFPEGTLAAPVEARDDAERRTREALADRHTFQRMLAPTPKSTAAPTPDGDGYGRGERRDLERLIESSR